MSEHPLQRETIRLRESASDKESAIRRCGEVLVSTGAVDPSYVESMWAREQSISTYVGEGVAIPHGTLEAKEAVRQDRLAVVRFDTPIDWGGDHEVTVCVVIAAAGNSHVGLLSRLAEILLDPSAAATLRETEDVDEVLRLLSPVGQENAE